MNIKSEQEMLAFGKSFAKDILQPPVVIELTGDVGAGKTTFVRGLAKGLGIKESVTSPSFTISKAYALPTGGHLVHYDFYRLNDIGLMADNLRENIHSNSIIIIEWGKSVKEIMPKNRIIISIELRNDNSREIVIKNNRKGACRGLPEVTTEDEGASPVTTAVGAEQTESLLSVSRRRPADDLWSTGASDPSPESTLRLFLDTSTPETILKLNNKEYKHLFANDLAEQLLGFIQDKLTENNKSWHDISKITFMSGPGSFTGLRIGASVVNALAHELQIPLYDHHGVKHKIILPDYGRPANISQPKK